MSHPVLPELPGTKPSTKEYTQSCPLLQTHRQQKMALLDIKGRRGPWSWKGSMLQCRAMPGQGRGRGLIGEPGKGKVAYRIFRGRDQEEDNILNVSKEYI